MAIFEIHSRNLSDLRKALGEVRSYQTTWYREDSPDFYMRLSGKHSSVANRLKSMFSVNVKEVEKVPPGVPLYPHGRVEEQPLNFSGQVLIPEQVSEFLDELPASVLVHALERRLWYIRSDAALRREGEEEETAAEMERINALYDPQIEEKDVGIGRLTDAVGRLKALAH